MICTNDNNEISASYSVNAPLHERNVPVDSDHDFTKMKFNHKPTKCRLLGCT